MSVSLVQTHVIKGSTWTRYLLRHTNGDIWWGELSQAASDIKGMEPRRLPRLGQLDPAAFFPRVTADMKRYTGDLEDPEVFVKYPNFLRYQNFDESEAVQKAVKNLQEREIRAVEKLKSAPHPNVCEYLGVVTDAKDFIIGIAYRRFATDLFNLLADTDFLKSVSTLPEDAPTPILTVESIANAIKAGMEHIHSLGLVHCDIRPENVFVNPETGQVVIGDFDGVHTPGEKLIGRTANKKWWGEDYQEDIADVRIDIGCVKTISGPWFDAWREKFGLPTKAS